MKKLGIVNNNLLSTLIFCIAMMLISLAAILFINRVTSDSCFQTLTNTVEQVATDIRITLECEEKQMRIIANMLADHTALSDETCQKYLTSLPPGKLISLFSVLLPNNQMIYANEKYVHLAEALDYKAELGKTYCLSDVFEDTAGKKYVAYRFPIKKAEDIIGFLYGYIKLKDLPELLELHAFEGEAYMYLVDGDTGNFLMDTWHDTLGNMYDANLLKRKSKKGRSFAQMKQDVVDGRAGYLVFESQTTGKDFYSCYQPVGIHNLSFQITLSEEVVFAVTAHIRKILFILYVGQIVCCMTYFAMLFRQMYIKNRQQQNKLEASMEMLEVQKTLFDAYRNPQLITEALRRTAEVISAEQIVFIVLDKNVVKTLYCWPEVTQKLKNLLMGKNIQTDIPEMYDAMISGKRILLNRTDKEKLGERWKMSALFGCEVNSFMSVPVADSNQHIIGALNAVNIGRLDDDKDTLEMVANSFLMSINNMNSHRQLHHLGTNDALTGLKNRNAYQSELSGYEKFMENKLCCIYIDANGLHELNNLEGHNTGEAMLKFLGVLLKELFGREYSYRIGGDEFVVFCIEMEASAIFEKLQYLKSQLDAQQYHISVGCSFGESGQQLQQMILEAEGKMYQEKERYYTRIGNDRRKR